MTPVISLVTGTVNRLPYLQAMLASFRANMPAGIPFEIIIVDGGSQDRTIQWCKEQSDVTLIEQGELLGAIKAFDTGAEAATGDYVLLANDDIQFMPDSILSALIHLETHPLCGAVAFKDDRRAPGYDTNDFKVQTMRVIHNGAEVDWPYAQVGLFRRWLGNEAGWWGSRDPIMGWKGSTYGGDNFLSARIYELGYTVGSVNSARCHDEVPPDTLRQHNHAVEQTNPGAYYKRYPTPPVFADQPQLANPQGERLRTLYLPIIEKGFGHYKTGLCAALGRVGLVYELDYINTKHDLENVVKTFQPHLLLAQCHNSYELPLNRLVAARNAKPDMIAVNWNGDVWEEGLTSDKMLAYLKHFDLTLVVNESTIPVLQAAGIQAAYWQVGYEPVNEADMPTNVHAHDVVFLANAYSESRKQLGAMLRSIEGLDVGLYGQGWPVIDGYTTYAFAVGRAIYQKAKIAISDNQFPDKRGFVSNRLFEALASGVLVLQQHVEGLEELTGLVGGKHYITWHTLDDLRELLQNMNDWSYQADFKKIAQAGQRYALKHHSFDARVAQLLDDLLPMIEGERV